MAEETSSYVPQGETSEDKKPIQTEDKQQAQEENNKPSSAEASAGKPVEKTDEVSDVKKINEQITEKIEETSDIIKQPANEPIPEQKTADELKIKEPQAEEPKIKDEPQIDANDPLNQKSEAKAVPALNKIETKENASPAPQNKATANKQDLELDKKEETAQADTPAVKQAPAQDQDISNIVKKEKVEIPSPVSPPAQAPLSPKTTKPPVAAAPNSINASKPEPSFTTKYINKLKEQLGLANLKRKQKARKNLDKIMEYARQTQKVTNDDVERITGVKDSQAENYLNKLIKQGKLVRFGKTKNIFYKPIGK